MIKSFCHRGLKELLDTGATRRVAPDLQKRIVKRLDVLNRATTLQNIDVPGYRLHPLKGTGRYAIDVNGPWRITFSWDGQNVTAVDLEQYH
ncbi:MAG: hypothetical protein EXQ86_00625 [Rhodospirillales bacterium]|nr:hypothetical protein [Rhodospirillales bacterium]